MNGFELRSWHRDPVVARVCGDFRIEWGTRRQNRGTQPLGMQRHFRRSRHCCQVSPRFLCEFMKNILQNTEKSLHIFKWFRKEICYNQTKLKTPKIGLSSKLPLKTLTKVRKYFRAPFLPLLVKIGGLTATTFPRPKVDHAHLLRTLLNSKTYRIIQLATFGKKLRTFIEQTFLL